ncbi:SDR family oxidoreductase [Amycolatopsis rubida]|uniref:SDR family oxidoreductase n=2 Tax=Pseudonocardiaceae TaxID=2070 RepID=A0ABX0C2S5_9PSEU|nr:SDR family oxidoreductase [Amycolatopsis rubida]MYW94346.1 SDR family oxidoreductase [Amycolatopsis rubida]NEC59335.1 SDR family oxidoreductase [Amycolatopsis rubida]
MRVLVTGASKGIGREVLRRLGNEGYRAVGVARTAPPDLGAGEEFRICDLTDLVATRTLLQDLLAEGPFYGLVNNAAVYPAAALEETRAEEVRAAVELHLVTALVCTQELVPGMRECGRGRIVNLSSRAALGKPHRTAYAASKAGVIGMSRTWALELAAAGITVNVIAPGPVDTASFRDASPPESSGTQDLMRAIPLQRMGRPEEIAHAVSFLLHPSAGFMTGQTLHVDGGLTTAAAGR